MNALRRTYRLTRWLAKHGEGTFLVALAAALWWGMDWLGDRPRVRVLGLLIFAAFFWVVVMPAIHAGHMPFRSWRRRTFVYRMHWQPALTLAGLAANGTLPKLGRVRSTATADYVTATMLPGQILSDWSSRVERLAEVFGAAPAWVEPGRRKRELVLQFTPSQGVQSFPADGRW